jgi:hypothetical protein
MTNTLGSVRLVGEFHIWGYCLRFGDPTHVNTRRQYWTPATEFVGHALPLPLTWAHSWEHASELVGEVTAFGNDAQGRWYSANLSEAKQWTYALICELIEARRLGSSPEAPGQSVTTQPAPGGTFEITRCEIVAVALTTQPAEMRLIDVERLKREPSDLQPAYVRSARDALAIEHLAEQAELGRMGREIDQMDQVVRNLRKGRKWNHRVSPNLKQS